MKLGVSKRRGVEGAKSSDPSSKSLAQVAIQFGRYVSLHTQQFLQEIRESTNPVEEVEKRSVQDFADAGMPELTDPFQKESLGKNLVSRIRSTLFGAS